MDLSGFQGRTRKVPTVPLKTATCPACAAGRMLIALDKRGVIWGVCEACKVGYPTNVTTQEMDALAQGTAVVVPSSKIRLQ